MLSGKCIILKKRTKEIAKTDCKIQMLVTTVGVKTHQI